MRGNVLTNNVLTALEKMNCVLQGCHGVPIFTFYSGYGMYFRDQISRVSHWMFHVISSFIAHLSNKALVCFSTLVSLSIRSTIIPLNLTLCARTLKSFLLERKKLYPTKTPKNVRLSNGSISKSHRRHPIIHKVAHRYDLLKSFLVVAQSNSRQLDYILWRQSHSDSLQHSKSTSPVKSPAVRVCCLRWVSRLCCRVLPRRKLEYRRLRLSVVKPTDYLNTEIGSYRLWRDARLYMCGSPARWSQCLPPVPACRKRWWGCCF